MQERGIRPTSRRRREAKGSVGILGHAITVGGMSVVVVVVKCGGVVSVAYAPVVRCHYGTSCVADCGQVLVRRCISRHLVIVAVDPSGHRDSIDSQR